jgi:hypothetical protein
LDSPLVNLTPRRKYFPLSHNLAKPLQLPI